MFTREISMTLLLHEASASNTSACVCSEEDNSCERCQAFLEWKAIQDRVYRKRYRNMKKSGVKTVYSRRNSKAVPDVFKQCAKYKSIRLANNAQVRNHRVKKQSKNGQCGKKKKKCQTGLPVVSSIDEYLSSIFS